MILLSIDTSGPTGTVGLAHLLNNQLDVLAQTALPGKTYSAQLVPTIVDLLAAHSSTIEAQRKPRPKPATKSADAPKCALQKCRAAPSASNTTAGTIPLAMNTAVEQGKLKKGSLVLMASVGAGFTVGAALLRWAF